MARSKVKVLTSKGKAVSPRLGATSSSKPFASPLMPGQKKNYKKNAAKVAIPNFGETGMTGRS